MRNFARTSLRIAATATIVATVASPIVAQAEGGTRVPGASADSTAADVVVTGDAPQGAWDDLRKALSAGVELYVRGAGAPPAEQTSGDAGAAAEPGTGRGTGTGTGK